MATAVKAIVIDDSDDDDYPGAMRKAQKRSKLDTTTTIPCEICKTQVPASQFLDHCAAHELEETTRRQHEYTKKNESTGGADDESFALALQLQERPEERKPDEVQQLGGKINLLQGGAFHLPDFVPMKLQEKLYMGLKTDKLIQDLNLPYAQNWDSKKCQTDTISPTQLFLFDIGERALSFISECTAEVPWGGKVHLDCCSTTGYNGGGNPPLRMHLDWGGTGGWVVVLSLGASCEFKYGNWTMDLAKSVICNSGDIVVLDGSVVHHGISRILPGSTPSYWSLSSTKRIAIQMRDHRKNVPGWADDGLNGQL